MRQIGRPVPKLKFIRFNATMKNRAGIYAIVNKLNGHKYVGQAVSLADRKKAHFQMLKSGKHFNTYFQNAYNKYGESNFTFVVLELVPRLADLTACEQHWIDTLKPEYNAVTNLYDNPFYDAQVKKANHRPDEPLIIHEDESFTRPDWHAWVYGGARNPQKDGRRNRG